MPVGDLSVSGDRHRPRLGHLDNRFDFIVDGRSPRVGSATTEPLSPEQAKRRLRTLARHTGMTAWVRRHPCEALSLGFLAGLLFGNCPQTRQATVRALLRLLSDPPR